MAAHELKTWPKFFQAILDGRKTFEARRNDRGFQEFDRLCLREYDPETEAYTGRELSALVTYVMRGPAFGVEAAHVVMGLSVDRTPKPLPMLLWCPMCGQRHIDSGEFEAKLHHTHACQRCGLAWRPAVVPTVGVQFLPGFKNPVEGEKP